MQMSDLYYDKKTKTLVSVYDYDVVRFEHRNKFPEDVECFVVFVDLVKNRMHIQQFHDFEENFIPIEINDVDQVQEWYGFDDIDFAKFKKILKEIIEYKE